MNRKFRGGWSLVGLLGVVAAMICGPVASVQAAPGDTLPTAPLADISPGDTCEARTVLKGTEITPFEVRILDVIRTSLVGFGDLIYFEVTDPAVAPLGVAEGMSGSPILCEIGGEDKVVGAISYGSAGIGPKAFATPIGDILNGQPSPSAFKAKTGELPEFRGRELVELMPPLMVSGVPSTAQKGFREKLASQGFDSVTFAAAAATDVPADSADLAPGGAFSVNYSFGDVSIGAICTISYRDGDDFWGCAHPLDLAGERSISFSGAHIYDVLGSAWSDFPAFKLGSATPTQVGSVLYDGPYAISGKLGRKAPVTPVKITYQSGDTKSILQSRVAREYGLPGGSPTGTVLPGLVAPTMVSRAQFSHGGQPMLQKGRICMKQTILGAGREVNACSRFASSSPAWIFAAFGVPTGAAFPTEFLVGGLGLLLGQVKYRKLDPGRLEVDVSISTGSGLRQIVGLRPVGKIRIGGMSRLAVISAERDGTRHRQIVQVRIPRKVKIRKGASIPTPRRFSLGVASGAIHTGGEAEDMYLATDNDRKSYVRMVAGLWSGRSSINSPKDLDQMIRDVFRKKAKLALSVPWSADPLTFPLRAGGDILVGNATLKVKAVPALSEGSNRRPVR